MKENIDIFVNLRKPRKFILKNKDIGFPNSLVIGSLSSTPSLAKARRIVRLLGGATVAVVLGGLGGRVGYHGAIRCV